MQEPFTGHTSTKKLSVADHTSTHIKFVSQTGHKEVSMHHHAVAILYNNYACMQIFKLQINGSLYLRLMQ